MYLRQLTMQLQINEIIDNFFSDLETYCQIIKMGSTAAMFFTVHMTVFGQCTKILQLNSYYLTLNHSLSLSWFHPRWVSQCSTVWLVLRAWPGQAAWQDELLP